MGEGRRVPADPVHADVRIGQLQALSLVITAPLQAATIIKLKKFL